ncbi:MAG TPA: hypothetical protein VJ305_11230 [Streptosporangiaceae bacterium]|nr:hypothetical protein [Streptosporangiaceae bacterium]
MVPDHGSKDHRGSRGAYLAGRDLRTPAGSERRRARRLLDVFAWRQPGEIRFDEVKVRPNRIGLSQRKFLKTALRFHPIGQFSLVEIEG